MEQAAVTLPFANHEIRAPAVKTGLRLIPRFERAKDSRIYNTTPAVSPQGEIASKPSM
ncbi:hypothetical protein ABZT51_29050 [Streptomyces sp. NPDC005373]|uniref:hypothetical protein n=1 Tax=unclassified Streptomyces TaxID=2593676 RepID=UPI0033BD8DC5